MMLVRLGISMSPLLLKHPGLSTLKRYYPQKKNNSILYVSYGVPFKKYIGILHSSLKVSRPIRSTTVSAVSITPSVKHAQLSKDTRKPLPESPIDPVNPRILPQFSRQNVKGLVLTRYIDYVRAYDKILKKNFQVMFKLYRTFLDGIGDFYHDIKWYVEIWRLVHSSPDGLRALKLKELELYMQMPKDMVKVAPAIIGTSIPIFGYVFFTLVFMYPRQFLTSHFWTPEQRDKFQLIQLQQRFTNNNLIVSYLHRKLKCVKKPIKHELARILTNIDLNDKSTYTPTCEDLMAIRDLFAKPPFSLKSLSQRHIKLLWGMHGLTPRFPSRVKLTEHAFLIQHMDYAIEREGGVRNMPLLSLERACVIRGLNPADMSRRDLIYWLEKWIAVTTSIEEQQISLLLHLPIFLGFNHPNNSKLYTHRNNGLKLKSDSTGNQ